VTSAQDRSDFVQEKNKIEIRYGRRLSLTRDERTIFFPV
jgi:hypothetical protein